MKILVIAPNPFFTDRGFSIRVYNQVKGLRERGHKIIVTAYNSGRNIDNIDIRRLPNIVRYGEDRIGANVLRLFMDLLLFFLCFLVSLKFQPDVIHGHLHEGALIGIIIGKILGIPVLLDAQGSLVGELVDRGTIKSKLLIRCLGTIEKFIYQNVDRILISSPQMEKVIRNVFRVKETKINFIIDGVDIDMFSVKDSGGLTRDKIGIPKDRKVVIYLGTLHKYYGTDCLLETIKYVVTKCRDIHFLIVGGPNVEKYKIMATNIGIRDFVTFTGKVKYENTPDYMKLADIAVAPKLGGTEANLKLGYYMASGLPVVCFDTEINREILGEYGIYVELGNHIALGEKIIELLNNQKSRENLSKHLKERVTLNYSLWRVIADLEAVYKRIIKK